MNSFTPWTPPTSYQEDRFYFFWNKHTRNSDARLRPLERQYKIGPYYADFAHEESKTVIEIDGAAYHSTPEQIARDKRRQAYIESSGWHVVRFSGKQTNNKADECVKQARFFIHSRMSSGDFRAKPPVS